MLSTYRHPDAFCKSANDDEIKEALVETKGDIDARREELRIIERCYLQIFEEARQRGLLNGIN